MKNLLRFIVRNHHFFVFLIFEIIALLLLIQYNQFHRATFLNNTGAAVSALHRLTNDVQDFFYLRDANQQLAEQNAHILNTLKKSYKSNKVSYREIYDSVYRKQWRYFTAVVINNSVNKQNNYLTVDKGRVHGVKEAMGVVGTHGVVGVVRHVSDNYATVISLLNPNFQLSARLTRTKYFGSLQWDGVDPRYCWLDDVPNHIIVNVGDSVETSGFSAIFPGGIPIGKVVEANRSGKNNFYHIKVQLFMQMQNLTHVYMVDNLYKDEIVGLETQIQTYD